MVQMEQMLYDAAMSKAKEVLPQKQHKDILVDLGMCYLKASPLHLAASHGDLEFVKRAMRQIPQLAEATDSRGQTPLHLASAEGHIEIVKELVSANVDVCTYQDIRGRNPLHVAVIKGNVDIVKELVKLGNIDDMCTSRDLGGRNPLHTALVNGKVDVLEVLLKACPLAAQDRVDRDQTILHLSVKHSGLEALELLLRNPKVQELVNAKDADGNTVLHLAVRNANFEMVKVIARRRTVLINIKNTDGFTAFDMVPKSEPEAASGNDSNNSSTWLREEKKRIRKFIRQRGWSRVKRLGTEDWFARKKDPIMVVAALIATVAFQAGISPPGGTWQDHSDDHTAGKSILANTSPEEYTSFILSNAVAFSGSLCTILLIAHDYYRRSLIFLFLQVAAITAAVVSMAFTYVRSVSVLMPSHNSRSAELSAIVRMVSIPMALAAFGFSVASVGIVKGKMRRRIARWRMKNHRSESISPTMSV